MNKENKEKFKLTTITHCTLIYFVRLCTVILIQGGQTSSNGTSGLGTLLAIIILIFFLPIMLTFISLSSKNSKYSYFENYSLLFYLSSFTIAIFGEWTSIAYLLTNLIPIFGFIIFLIEGKKS